MLKNCPVYLFICFSDNARMFLILKITFIIFNVRLLFYRMSTNLEDLEKEMATNIRKRPPLTKTGKVLLGITGASFFAVVAVATPFLLPALRKVCLPYVPATTQQVENVMKLLSGKSGRLVDLGSGDGRIVIQAARMGFKADGIELNPWLVWYSRLRSLFQGTAYSTRFYTRNLWKFDVSGYDHIVVFGVDTMMEQLRSKLAKEISADCRVIACRFPFVSCEPQTEHGSGLDTVWLYTKSCLSRCKDAKD